jgi:NADPH2:quinone reductase
MPAPEPGPGEVRVRLALSGVNPGDTKKRSDWLGYGMPFPRVVPHSDGSGVIDAVGDGAHPARVGQRVWATAHSPIGRLADERMTNNWYTKR